MLVGCDSEASLSTTPEPEGVEEARLSRGGEASKASEESGQSTALTRRGFTLELLS